MPQHRDVEAIRVFGIDDDLCDLLAISPVERSGRWRPSPLPAYITCGFDGATAIVPTDPDGWPSKIGAQVCP